MGFFITFEGGDGAGKSTQIKRLSDWLKKEQYQVVLTREPGGSPGAEAVRHILLSGAAKPFGPKSEAFLFAAARLDHMRQTILPALDENKIVLCDRFYDSTRAYQGADEEVSIEYLKQMDDIAVGGRHPDLTLVFDIDPTLGLKRVKLRSVTGKETEAGIDRFEKDNLDILRKRRAAFLQIASEEPQRCVVLDASQDADDVTEQMLFHVKPRLTKLDAHILA